MGHDESIYLLDVTSQYVNDKELSFKHWLAKSISSFSNKYSNVVTTNMFSTCFTH